MCHDCSDGGSYEKRLNTEIHQARDRSGRIVGVQRTEDKVTCKTGVRSNARCFEISNFTNHDDVRCLAQNGTQGGRKSHSDLRIHLYLIDPGHLILDRLFYRDDFAVRLVDVIEARIERGGLTGTGRPGDQ